MVKGVDCVCRLIRRASCISMEQAAADLDGLFCWMKVGRLGHNRLLAFIKGEKNDVCERKTEREDDKRERDTAAMLLFRGGKIVCLYLYV